MSCLFVPVRDEIRLPIYSLQAADEVRWCEVSSSRTGSARMEEFFFFFLPLGVMNESPRIELTCATGLIESSGQIDGLIEYWGYETEH